jgi:ISXO2-like transposase domain
MLDLFEFMRLVETEKSCLEFLLQQGILCPERSCTKCGRQMRLFVERGLWRCTASCGGSVSIRDRSFFAGSRLTCREILLLGYLWINRVPTTSIMALSGSSSATVCAFTSYYRQLVADSLDEVDCQVGGRGIIVEVDESKISKRKYQRGHHVEGAWAVGGIERADAGKVFIAVVEDRGYESLLGVLRRYVLPGSILYSDMWRAYPRIAAELEMEHRTVNHSREFVSADGVHTNSIEGTWCGLKLMIPKRNRSANVEDHLWEYIWRKPYRDNVWGSFLEALKSVSYE